MKKLTALLLCILTVFVTIPTFSSSASDNGNYFNVSLKNSGWDIYTPSSSTGYAYRYGPSIIQNDDGSFDAWFACKGCSGLNVLDYISYKHSSDGKTWEKEKIVLDPTPHSDDRLSCCDPGVIKFGGYYYIGYTSTLDKAGYDNSVFVARSKNPDGPYEKWDGNGWGGFAKPLIRFEGNGDQWGIGEVAFVELNDTLYIYYTLRCETGSYTMVSLADATAENWPATVSAPTKAITMGNSQSAADVKYDEATGNFIAVAAVNGFSADSYMAFFTSWDGLTFTECDRIYKNMYYYAANQGLSGSPNGHIKVGQTAYLAYAYGSTWGNWATRMAPLIISTSASTDFSDSKDNLIRSGHGTSSNIESAIGITTTSLYFVKTVGSSFTVNFQTFNTNMSRTTLSSSAITYSGYDKSIISFTGNTCKALKPGRTWVRACYNGLYCTFTVDVRASGVSTSSTDVMEWYSPVDTYYIPLNSPLYFPQLSGNVMTYKGQIGEAFNDPVSSKAIFGADAYPVTYSNFDSSVINITEYGYVMPVKNGSTNVTVTICGNKSFTVKVVVVDSILPRDIYLDPSGGDCNVESIISNVGFAYGYLPTPTKSGYRFAGWINEDGEEITSSTKITSSYISDLYATWEKYTDGTYYYLTLNSNGGYFSGETERPILPGSEIGALPTPTRSGYNFAGWYNSEFDVTLTPDTPYSFGKNLTFTANWEKKTYTVTYDANGGTNAPAQQVKEYGSALTLTSDKPTRAGYTFLGWAKSSDSDSVDYKGGESYTANSPLTLYAVWEKNAESSVTIENYTLSVTCSENVNYIRLAPGSYTTASEIKNAPGMISINEAVIANGIDSEGTFRYELSAVGTYSVWI